MDKNSLKILDKLPEFLKNDILSIPERKLENMEEIRIKAYTDTLIIHDEKEMCIRNRDRITQEVLDDILNRLLNYSYYAYEEELADGYITIEGGHRVGICGRAVFREGKLSLLKDISSINIRRGREVIGASEKISSILFNDGVQNVLIVSPPRCGKTTVLRDMARWLSNQGYRVGVCDERSEIAGCCNGKASYELGMRTDVLDGCPKAQGITMLIRAMAPDVIITDEIGRPEDIAAVENALCAGVKVITSIHGYDYADLMNSRIEPLIQGGVFESLIFLTSKPSVGTVSKIMKLDSCDRGGCTE